MNSANYTQRNGTKKIHRSEKKKTGFFNFVRGVNIDVSNFNFYYRFLLFLIAANISF